MHLFVIQFMHVSLTCCGAHTVGKFTIWCIYLYGNERLYFVNEIKQQQQQKLKRKKNRTQKLQNKNRIIKYFAFRQKNNYKMKILSLLQ